MFCPHCGKEIADSQVFCQYCGMKVGEPAASAPAAGEGRQKTPWENREQEGFLNGLFKTVKDTLLTPTGFFKKMPVIGGITDPLIYALIFGMAGTILYYVWNIAFQGMMSSYMPPEMKNVMGRDIFQGIALGVMAIIVPIAMIASLFVWAGILHLFLMLVKGTKAGFEATFRVVAYSYGANLINIVPVCGSIIAGVWSVVLVIIGLKEAHETTGGKAAFAVLFPFVVCCGLVIIILIMVGVMAASLTSTMHR